jgi:hypothetical protein
VRKSISYGLSGCRGFTGRGIQDRHDNNRFFKGFRFSYIDRLLTKIAESGVDLMVVLCIKVFLRKFAES